MGLLGLIGVLWWSADTKGTSTGARLAIFLVLMLLVYLLWRATRAWLAYKPGAVDVQQLEDATPASTPKPSDVDLTAKLRQRLSDSSMYPPTTLPAQAPPETFLELLGDVEIDPKKLGTALPRLLSRLRPKLAYRVGGVLQFRKMAPDQFGMTVTVTAFLFGGSRATTIWGSDWNDVIRKASSWVISTLLPVTRAGRMPPWRRWWGRELNPELYEAYQEANELSRAGRHLEALEKYFTTVRLDPKNPYLRAELAETQEKLGLHIDALDTCQRALALDGQYAGSYRERLWLGRHRLRYFWHPRRFRELLGLRYRNSIILGTAEVTADQWCNGKGTNGEHTGKNLTPLLVERYWPTVPRLTGTGQNEQTCKDSLWKMLTNRADREKIRLVFQLASWQETKLLARDNKWASVWLYWPVLLWSWARMIWPAAYYQSVRGPRPPVTLGAFRVNRKAWAPLRLAWASWAYNESRGERERRAQTGWGARSKIAWNGLNVKFLERKLRSATRRARGDWLTNYNVACAYAVAVQADWDDVHRQRDLARHAVEHLEKAVLTTRKNFTMVERAWLVEEDPDLTPLRDKKTPGNELFNDFARTAYPRAETFEENPPGRQPDEQLREYDYRLLEETAKVMQQVWNRRSETADIDIQRAAEWLRTESKIWMFIRQISGKENKYRWQDRVSLIHYIQADCRSASCSAPGFPPPLVLDETTSTNARPGPTKVENALATLNRDIATAHAYSTSDQGQKLLRERAADGVARLDAPTIRQLSMGYAAAWQTLDDWLEREVDHRQFRKALGRVPQLTRPFPSTAHGPPNLEI
ncbi:hypothetical protein DY245_21690 [Streptomyces inhibens]|uniref:Uncharacterized protein n=2 Tax=Streptomyces inhibens TaxID=2293571 RepID=A0A371Q136_STRIH|nr:hypothetical protein DY245_21690 [Streptomyces inhibens]